MEPQREAAPGMADVARRLADLLSQESSQRPDVRAFQPTSPPPRVAAVDGSSVILAESGSHLIGAFRAAGVFVERGQVRPIERNAPEVCLLSHADAAAALSLRLGGRDVAPLPPKACLDALRSHTESALALRLVEQLDAGDALLLDGSLAVRPPVLLLDEVLKRAAERRVDVIGVCKSTSMTIGAAPAIAVCQLAARDFPTATWSVEVKAPPNVRGRVLVARLSRA
ncbi:MAG: DNA double-strand break repair nuclease NurA, partial [Candidatus Thermoplasmatota archaeon]